MPGYVKWKTSDENAGLQNFMNRSVSPNQQEFPLVSILLVNLDGKEYLERCLSSVLAQDYPNFEVILIDNGSTDGSIEFVKERFPTVMIIQNEENLGFSTANNIGIETSRGEYLVTLNNDTEVEGQWLAEMVGAIQSAPGVGMIAPKMLNHYRREIIDSTGIEIDLAGIAWNRRHGERDEGREREPLEVFGPCAGAALYSRELLEQIGLFDQDYFSFYEDADLAWRARLAGWRCLYVPTARVYHVHSGSWNKNPSFKLFLIGRNKVWTIFKNAPLAFLLYLPLILLYDLAAVFYHLLIGRETNPLKGRLAALPALPIMWKKRVAIQRKRNISFLALTKLMRIPQNPIGLAKRVRQR